MAGKSVSANLSTRLFVVLVMLSLTVGCRLSNDTGENNSVADITGTEWLLTLLNGEALLEDTRITLSFADKVTGNAGCNYYEAEYRATGGTLVIPEVVRTAMDCQVPEGILEQENAYVEALYSAASYQIVEDQLEIANEVGETTLVFTRSE
jgi:heat shock protein HslJ